MRVILPASLSRVHRPPPPGVGLARSDSRYTSIDRVRDRPSRGDIEAVRILHEAQDLPRDLEDDPRGARWRREVKFTALPLSPRRDRAPARQTRANAAGSGPRQRLNRAIKGPKSGNQR